MASMMKHLMGLTNEELQKDTDKRLEASQEFFWNKKKEPEKKEESIIELKKISFQEALKMYKEKLSTYGKLQPAAPKDIKALEDFCKETFRKSAPRELVEVLKVHGNEYPGITQGINYHYKTNPKYRPYPLSDIREILSDHKINTEVALDNEAEDDVTHEIPWNKQWLPFTADGSGNSVCIDMTDGKVRDFDHEFGGSNPSHPNFTEWFGYYVQTIIPKQETSTEGFLSNFGAALATTVSKAITSIDLKNTGPLKPTSKLIAISNKTNNQITLSQVIRVVKSLNCAVLISKTDVKSNYYNIPYTTSLLAPYLHSDPNTDTMLFDINLLIYQVGKVHLHDVVYSIDCEGKHLIDFLKRSVNARVLIETDIEGVSVENLSQEGFFDKFKSKPTNYGIMPQTKKLNYRDSTVMLRERYKEQGKKWDEKGVAYEHTSSVIAKMFKKSSPVDVWHDYAKHLPAQGKNNEMPQYNSPLKGYTLLDSHTMFRVWANLTYIDDPNVRILAKVPTLRENRMPLATRIKDKGHLLKVEKKDFIYYNGDDKAVYELTADSLKNHNFATYAEGTKIYNSIEDFISQYAQSLVPMQVTTESACPTRTSFTASVHAQSSMTRQTNGVTTKAQGSLTDPQGPDGKENQSFTYNEGSGEKEVIQLTGPLSEAYTKALNIYYAKKPVFDDKTEPEEFDNLDDQLLNGSAKITPEDKLSNESSVIADTELFQIIDKIKDEDDGNELSAHFVHDSVVVDPIISEPTTVAHIYNTASALTPEVIDTVTTQAENKDKNIVMVLTEEVKFLSHGMGTRNKWLDLSENVGYNPFYKNREEKMAIESIYEKKGIRVFEGMQAFLNHYKKPPQSKRH